MRREVLVVRRIPFAVIHAVENAEQIAAPRAQQAIKAIAELRHLNLFGILAADGRKRGGKIKPSLQRVRLSVEFHPLLEGIEPETKAREQRRIEEALISQVVNREERRGARKEGIRSVDRAQISRNEASLPVVAVNQIGR